MTLKYKKCTIEDIRELISISKSTFINAFEKKNNPEDFKNYIDNTFSFENKQKEMLNSNSIFYFVYLKETLVGYFKINMSKAQAEQFKVPSMELARIYVLEKFQGQNIGKEMLLNIIEMARLAKVDFLWLGVWQENEGAIKFYKQNGFDIFGSHPFYIGNDKQMDWLMKYHLV